VTARARPFLGLHAGADIDVWVLDAIEIALTRHGSGLLCLLHISDRDPAVRPGAIDLLEINAELDAVRIAASVAFSSSALRCLRRSPTSMALRVGARPSSLVSSAAADLSSWATTLAASEMRWTCGWDTTADDVDSFAAAERSAVGDYEADARWAHGTRSDRLVGRAPPGCRKALFLAEGPG
jgi:hypothetical protein